MVLHFSIALLSKSDLGNVVISSRSSQRLLIFLKQDKFTINCYFVNTNNYDILHSERLYWLKLLYSNTTTAEYSSILLYTIRFAMSVFPLLLSNELFL